MKRISSRDNPFFKSLRRWVDQASTRRDAGIAILEGVHLADACLRSGTTPRHIVVGASALDRAEVLDVLDRSRGRTTAFVLDDALFASLSQLATGVPLLTIVDCPTPAMPGRIETTVVLLDRVQDPGNVGSILRSAAAAGIGDVYLSHECAGAWSPKVVRAAMGAHFHLRLFEDCDLRALRPARMSVVSRPAPMPIGTIYAADLRGPVAWLFGHEGQGVDAALMQDALTLRIPQPGHGESINVAASAAVCLFEQARQRQAA